MQSAPAMMSATQLAPSYLIMATDHFGVRVKPHPVTERKIPKTMPRHVPVVCEFMVCIFYVDVYLSVKMRGILLDRHFHSAGAFA